LALNIRAYDLCSNFGNPKYGENYSMLGAFVGGISGLCLAIGHHSGGNEQTEFWLMPV
jgi:hypothetical protein